MKKSIVLIIFLFILTNTINKANADFVYGFAPAPTNTYNQTNTNTNNTYQNNTNSSVYGFAPAPTNTYNQTNTNTNNTYQNNTNSSVYGFAPTPTNTYNQTNINTNNTYQNNTNSSVYGFSPAYEQKPINNYSKPKFSEYSKAPEKIITSYTENDVTIKKVAKEVNDTIYTSNPTNSTVSFFYYIPAQLESNPSKPYPVIIWIPGLDGNGGESISEELYDLANTKGYAILSPAFKFNDEDFKNEKSYQYPQAWSGEALVSMLEKAKRNGLNYSKLYMVGFSAGAQFASRFSFIRPELIDACALLGSGARVKPTENNGVKYFIGIGTMDDEFRRENAEIFNNAARNLGITTVYKKYNIDHSTSSEEMKDVVKFFEDVRNGLI